MPRKDRIANPVVITGLSEILTSQQATAYGADRSRKKRWVGLSLASLFFRLLLVVELIGQGEPHIYVVFLPDGILLLNA